MKPSLDSWLEEAKADPSAHMCGSYITHTGVVRSSPKALVRGTGNSSGSVKGMRFSCDYAAVEAAADTVRNLPGIYYVKVWVSEGDLKVGDDIMQILIGGDIRVRVMDALSHLLNQIKNYCVKEEEIF